MIFRNYSAGACLAPSLIGGGLGWGQVLKNCLHRACPHPNLTCSRQRRQLFGLSKSAWADSEPQAAAPEGEGVGALNSYDFPK